MFGRFKKNKDKELLNQQLAGQMLQNVFDVCNIEPNSVSLEVLESYSNYRKDRFFLQRIVLIILMIFFFTLPLLFVGPKISTENKTEKLTSPIYKVTVSSFIPIERLTATINNKNVPVYETADNTYSVEPAEGGIMTVTATAYNHQFAVKTINVSTIDNEPPNAISDETIDDIVYIYLEDKGSGVDYDKIYALSATKEKIMPLDYDEREGYVAFDYPYSSLNLHIPDKADNILRLILTVK